MKKYFLWLLTLIWAGLTLYLTTIPNFHPSSDSILSFFISNGGHIFFFGVLAVLLRSLVTLPLSLVTSSLYGLFIEFFQLNIPGRSFSLTDWSLDILGIISFLFLTKKLQSRS